MKKKTIGAKSKIELQKLKEKRREDFVANFGKPVIEMNKKISVNLDLATQWRELEILMEEDGQKNISAYIVYLIYQEKKRRAGLLQDPKRPVGRPKKVEEIEDSHKYPAPYKGGAPYSAKELKLYYEFRNEPIPPLPKPLTAEEIAKFD
jgi:hypothetical protein|tara:strand:+ start:1420 stop:1866 length:447 start_codon:yes stop_codon:yes gene_type:complete